MFEFLEPFLGDKFLACSNLLAVIFIAIHLVCEFGHYIHEFISSRKDAKKLDNNNELLHNLVQRIERIEQTMSTKKCPLKDEDHVIHIK